MNNPKTLADLASQKDFFFVQIGANDGQSGDPLRGYIKKYHWSGIMVEPVPHLYKKLKQTHEGRDNLTFRNVAISKDGGSMKFYSIQRHEGDHPAWNQLGSFNKDVISSHREQIPEFDKYFKEEETQTITFDSLVEGVTYIDLLCIDAEGYDFEIIKSIDFNKHKPSAILFENRHLKEKSNEVHRFLTERGYNCTDWGSWNEGDTLALIEDRDEWRRQHE